MRRRTVLCFLLFVGLLVGLTMEPDSGTAASLGRPDVTGATVGANHAKPLPRLLSVDEIARTAAFVLAAVLVLATLVVAGTPPRAPRESGSSRSLVWARVPARRGPPSPALG